jgi:hypothetical protein
MFANALSKKHDDVRILTRERQVVWAAKEVQ